MHPCLPKQTPFPYSVLDEVFQANDIFHSLFLKRWIQRGNQRIVYKCALPTELQRSLAPKTGIEPVTTSCATKYDCTTTLFSIISYFLCPEPDSNWYSLLQKISLRHGGTRFPTELLREAVRCCGLLGYSPLFSLPQTHTFATGHRQKNRFLIMPRSIP